MCVCVCVCVDGVCVGVEHAWGAACVGGAWRGVHVAGGMMHGGGEVHVGGGGVPVGGGYVWGVCMWREG